MAVTLTYQLDTTRALDAAGELIDAASDLTPLMERVGLAIEGAARERIEVTNTSPDGAAWMPSDRVEQFGGKTLFESGALAASIVSEGHRDHALIGSNLIYAGVHQTGAIITAKDGGALTFQLPDGQFVEVASVEIPARPYLGVSAEDEITILELADSYFREVLA